MKTTTAVDAIVIGGSTGALEALAVLLPAIPRHCAIPVAVVVHLPPTKPSHLAEVLAMRTSLPVQEVEDKQPVVGGVIYVAPPNYHLLIERGGNFALSADEQIHFSRPAIDILFDSASDSYRERLAGIILTGANADGARGLATIKRRGGLAIVQSPIGAIARNMPDAAIAASRTAHVLSLEVIASWLKDLAGGGPLKESQ
jgi:two-component system, chemotaxis family, protein-glutamate methylesterase/glutaminase